MTIYDSCPKRCGKRFSLPEKHAIYRQKLKTCDVCGTEVSLSISWMSLIEPIVGFLLMWAAILGFVFLMYIWAIAAGVVAFIREVVFLFFSKVTLTK